MSEKKGTTGKEGKGGSSDRSLPVAVQQLLDTLEAVFVAESRHLCKGKRGSDEMSVRETGKHKEQGQIPRITQGRTVEMKARVLARSICEGMRESSYVFTLVLLHKV